MMMHVFLAQAVDVGIGAAAGALLGWIYFPMLRRAVEAFVERPNLPRLLGWSAARMLAATMLLTLLARLGAVALLAALLGFLLARTRLLHGLNDHRAADTRASQ